MSSASSPVVEILPQGRRIALLQIVLFKIFYLGLLLLALKVSPDLDEWAYENNLGRWPVTGEPTLATYWATWDAAHYLQLAEQGYEKGRPRCAFYPLWPALIAAIHQLGIPTALVGVLLSNVFSGLAAWLFFLFAERKTGTLAASMALTLLLVFPGSLFFQFPYTESLFLFLLMGLVLSLENENNVGVVLCALLLPLTRPSGQFLLLPLTFIVWTRRSRLSVTALLALLAGIGGYYGFMWLMTGNALEGVQAQHFWRQNRALSGSLLMRPVESVQAFFNVTAWHGYTGSLLDRLMFLAFCAGLPWLWRRNKEWFWWAVALGLAPGLFNSFVSFIRFAGVIWPLVILSGEWLSQTKRPLLPGVVFFVAAMLHLWLLWEHVNFRWAG